MSDKNRYIGDRGEHLGAAILLCFFTPVKPSPDPGDDLWMDPVDPARRNVNFRVQIKSAKRFVTSATRLDQWVDGLEERPVILLHVQPIDLTMTTFRFLVLHRFW